MSDTVIRVEGLGKKYTIGQRSENGYRTLRDTLTDLLSFRRLRSSVFGRSTNGRRPPFSGRSDEFWALKDVSFEVTQGEVVGIIGRNGAGKSTLLKILSRITEPTEGRVRIRGRVASLLEVGTGFHPELTGRENVFLNGAILGMTREEIKRKFDEIVAFAEVEKFLDTPVKRYSSGMYVRLAFAVAAHLEPEILIVDEVLAVGDEAFQKKCLGKMDKVAQQGRTVFFVSHNMPSIKRLSSTAILLSDGRIVERGSADAVVAQYLQSGSTGKTIVELADSEHLTKSPLQIRTVEVLNSRGHRADLLLFGEAMFVRLGVEVRQAIAGARIGIGIHANGVRVSTLHTPAVDLAPSAQLHSFTCKLPSSILLPNVYSLDVGAYRAETGGLDWVPEAIDFRVEAVGIDGSSDHDHRDPGLIKLDASWESDLLGAPSTLIESMPSIAKRSFRTRPRFATVTNQLTSVITTIQRPTESVCKLVARLGNAGAKLIVVGDKKGPASFDLEGVEFLSLAAQLESKFDLAGLLPTGHYARKNIGYLKAIRLGASCVYETDDDNAPLDSWAPRAETIGAAGVQAHGWVNVYRLFTDEEIWPRGFPLDALSDSFSKHPSLAEETIAVQAPIQQGLVNNSPDVDAIWRLVMDGPFAFQAGPSVLLPRGAWCPFNSQSTWWFPVAYPLMYLPSFCSFRMTDIWRSFIAQRCLWELDLGVVFHAAEVVQQRNEHDLMRDFKDEVPGYLRNRELADRLEALKLARGADAVGANLVACYEELVKAEFFPEKELELVNAWLAGL